MIIIEDKSSIEETKMRSEAQRMKRYSECEETFEKEQFSFVCKGKSYEVNIIF